MVQRAIAKLNIPVMSDSLKSSIAPFHTTKIIVFDNSKFTFVGSIHESMYRCVSGESKLSGEYKKRPVSGPRILNPEMQHNLDEANKIMKGGKPKQPKEGHSTLPLPSKKRKTKGDSSKAAPSSPKRSEETSS